MDQDRFDSLARAIAIRIPRRGLGVLAAALAALGLDETDARNRSDRARRASKHRKKRRSADDRRNQGAGNSADSNPSGPNAGSSPGGRGAAELRKKKPKPKKCARAGGSCKKPKKRKAPKCCSGLRCDAKTKRCVAPASPDVDFDQPAFNTCLEPVTGPILNELDVCTGPCNGGNESSCEACWGDVLARYTEPLSACLLTGFLAEYHASTPRSRPASNKRASRGRAASAGKCQWLAYDLQMEDAKEALHNAVGGALLATLGISVTAPISLPNLLLVGAAFYSVSSVKTAMIAVQRIEQELGCPPELGFCKRGSSSAAGDGVCCPREDHIGCGHGSCCDPRRCERCVGGQCQPCAVGEYCIQEMTGSGAGTRVAHVCEDCPGCRGACEVLAAGLPVDGVPGTAPCAKTFCSGPCPNGERCVSGQCTDRCGSAAQGRAQADEICCEDGSFPCGATNACCGADETCNGTACVCANGGARCLGHCCAAGQQCITNICRCPNGAVLCNGACCQAGQICHQNACTEPCPEPNRTPCGGKCCPDGATCQGATCTCADGQPTCGFACCAAGETCTGNVCEPPCPDNGVRCGDTCCPEGDACTDDACEAPCPPNSIRCAGECCVPHWVCNGICRNPCADVSCPPDKPAAFPPDCVCEAIGPGH